MPGFENLVTDGTAWARDSLAEPTVFRNLVTGEERRVARPSDADRLRCVPAFCLGHARGGWFVQAWDGSNRRRLDYPGTPVLIGALDAAPPPIKTPAGYPLPPRDSGLLLIADRVLLDPLSGRFGVATHGAQCDVRYGPVKNEIVYSWSTPVDGACGGPRRSAYIGGND
jgi:hypothetical protein